MKIEEIERLILYNQWANSRILHAASKISMEQLRLECGLSQGSIFSTLIHIVDAQLYWRTACQDGNAPEKKLSPSDFNHFQQMRSRFELEDTLLLEYVRSLADDRLGKPIQYRWPRAKPRQQILWHVLFHIVNHGTHHRAEVGRYLDGLGKSPRDMDFILFVTKYARSE